MLIYVGATLAIARLIYWFQLSGRIGPIVLNIARVLPDIITVIITFGIILVAFGMGVFYFVISKSIQNVDITDSSQKFQFEPSSNQQYRNHTEWHKTFKKVLESMAWAVLNPGPSDDVEITGSTIEVLYVTYQVLVVIILLNLLIVMMNTTVQRLQDRKHLYWKFARTSIWLEFMKDGIVLPPPFIIVSMTITSIFRLTKLITYGGWWMFKKWRKESVIGVLELMKTRGPSDLTTAMKTCRLDPNESKRRKDHAYLMEKLIHRFMNEEKTDEEARKISTVENADENNVAKVSASIYHLSSNNKHETIA